MVAAACSRSHGHSRRSRSVRRWSSRRALARPSISASSRGRNRDRRGRRRGWRITPLEADLALVAVLHLRRDAARKALAVDEDVPHLARLRRRERGLVLVVVLLRGGRRHLDVRRHLRLELLAEQRRPEVVLLELVERDVVLFQRGL